MGSQGFCSKSVICLACLSLRCFVSSFFTAGKCLRLYGSSSQGFLSASFFGGSAARARATHARRRVPACSLAALFGARLELAAALFGGSLWGALQQLNYYGQQLRFVAPVLSSDETANRIARGQLPKRQQARKRRQLQKPELAR